MASRAQAERALLAMADYVDLRGAADQTEEALQVRIAFAFRELDLSLKPTLEAHPRLARALDAYARRRLRECSAELAVAIRNWEPRTAAAERDREQLRVWAWVLARVEERGS